MSGTFREFSPSNATVRSPANRTPGVCGWASGPATTSNSAFNGAGPSRRRRVPQRLLRRARHRQPGQPGGQLAPHPGVAQPREQPQREHEVHPGPRRQVRSRRCTVLVCSRTSSTSSNGRYWVNSPRWPGAKTPAATVTACVIVVVAD